MRIVAVFVLLALLQSGRSEAHSVKGRVILRTEDGAPATRFIPGRHRIVYSSSVVSSQSCGEAVLTNTLDIALLEIKPPCSVEKLQAELMLQQADLSLKQEPRPLVVPACKEDVCEYIMEVRWPRKKPPEKRAEYFDKGMQTYATDPESSLAYLADAAWGAMDYTKAAADRLEEDKRFQDLWMFLDATEGSLYDADSIARFDLLMQKARAGNADQNPVVALQAAAEALKLNPKDPSPVAVVREALVWNAKSGSVDSIVPILKMDPEIRGAFGSFYSAWEAEGKPSGYGGDSIERQIAFTLHGAGPAETPSLFLLGLPTGGEPFLAMGKPFDAEHAWLGRLSGDWTFTSTVWAQNGQQPLESEGMMHAEVVLNGHYVEQVWRGDFMGAPFESRGFEGYDTINNRYVRTWIDDKGSGILTSTGTCVDGGEKCFYLANKSNQLEHEGRTTTAVVTWLTDDIFTEELYGIDSSGTKVKLTETVVKRKP